MYLTYKEYVDSAKKVETKNKNKKHTIHTSTRFYMMLVASLYFFLKRKPQMYNTGSIFVCITFFFSLSLTLSTNTASTTSPQPTSRSFIFLCSHEQRVVYFEQSLRGVRRRWSGKGSGRSAIFSSLKFLLSYVAICPLSSLGCSFSHYH